MALECYIEPILMYECEAWTISKQLQKKLNRNVVAMNLVDCKEIKQCYERLTQQDHSCNLFWPCDEKREARTSSDNWNDRRKTQEKMLDGLTKWQKVGQVTDTLKAKRNKNASKVFWVASVC